jgi:hypothetical protein
MKLGQFRYTSVKRTQFAAADILKWTKIGDIVAVAITDKWIDGAVRLRPAQGRFDMLAKLLPIVLITTSVLAQTPGGNNRNSPSDSASKRLDDMLNKGTAAQPLPLTNTTSVPTDAATTRPGIAPGSPPQAVMREGSLIVDRTGRVVRSADGSQVEFVFDTDGEAMKDPPVIILPNLKLMAMEQAALGTNRDLRFRITGMVTEYRSRNYVLLDKVVVVPQAAGRF